MEQMTGLAASAVLGRHPLELFPFMKEAGLIERLEQALAGEATAAVEFPYHVPQSGKSGWVSDTFAPLRNVEREIIGVIATVRDVTERKQANEALREKNAELEAALAEVKKVSDLRQSRRLEIA